MQANAGELERRVGLVRKMLAAGLRLEEIVEIVGEVWGVARVQVQRYVKRVYAEPQKLAEEELPHLQARAIRHWNERYRRALAAGKYGEALRALDSRDRIWGILDGRGRFAGSAVTDFFESGDEGWEAEEDL